MTGMLASVNSIAETQIILSSSASIIDLKQPDQGALGALPTNLVKQIVNIVKQKKPVSATIGDLPMQPDLVFNAVQAMLDCHVDYVKIGIFPEGDLEATLNQLSELTQSGHQLIAVLFADQRPDLTLIPRLKNAGFSGVMLDTSDKTKGSLCHHLSTIELDNFINLAKSNHLLTGLAGSLQKEDIPGLLPLNADYLGFRGALCENQLRNNQLVLSSVQTICHFFEQTTSA